MQYSKPRQMLVEEHEVITSVLDALERVTGAGADDAEFPQEFYERAFDFFSTFADKCHHAKEEAYLFPLLEARGVPREGGPLGCMLSEHEQGRKHVAAVREALPRAGQGDANACRTVREEALAYAALLRQHILKENQVLFMLADQAMTAEDKEELWRKFEHTEEHEIGAGTHQKYLALAKELRAAAGL